jgi:hypothetical protein
MRTIYIFAAMLSGVLVTCLKESSAPTSTGPPSDTLQAITVYTNPPQATLPCATAATTLSAEATWLQSDLAAHPAKCILAYWHKSLFSSGDHGPATAMRPLHYRAKWLCDITFPVL